MVSLSLRIRLAATPIEIGSSPAKGSSYMISSGSSAMARASAMRRAMPPETCEMRSGAAPRRPTALSFISTMSRIMLSGRSLCSRSGKATLSNTLRSVNSAPNWNSMPSRRRSRYSWARSAAFTRLAVEDHLPLRRRIDAGNQAQQRGLAAARAAEDGRDLAAREAQRHVVQDRAGRVIAEADAVDLDQGVDVQALTGIPRRGRTRVSEGPRAMQRHGTQQFHCRTPHVHGRAHGRVARRVRCALSSAARCSPSGTGRPHARPAALRGWPRRSATGRAACRRRRRPCRTLVL